jgi:hypothetical protein
MRQQLPARWTAVAFAGATSLLLCVFGCHETEHGPPGSNTGGGLPPGGDLDTDTNVDSGSDTSTGDDTDEDGGAGGCAVDEIAEPGGDNCWLACPIGQTWDEGFCNGSAQALAWESAIAACSLVGDGHHLASRQEILDILDNCEDALSDGLEGYCDPCGASAACGAMFGYDALSYWTSSDGEYAPWAASFDSGLVFMSDTEFDLHHARCVRSE